MIPGYLGSDPVRQLWTFRVIKAMPAWWKGALLILIGAVLNPIICFAGVMSVIYAGYYVGSKYPNRIDRAALKGLQTGIVGSLLFILLLVGIIGTNLVPMVQKEPLIIPGMILSFAQIIGMVFITSIWSAKRASVLRNEL